MKNLISREEIEKLSENWMNFKRIRTIETNNPNFNEKHSKFITMLEREEMLNQCFNYISQLHKDMAEYGQVI